MNQERLPEFLRLFNSYKGSEDYKERKEQFSITPVFKEIIHEAIAHAPIANQTLTDLIQIFKYNCSDVVFDAKLASLVRDEKKRKQLHDKAYGVLQPGYTNAGKNGVSGLTDKQLQQVLQLLRDAFLVRTVNDAIQLVSLFDALQIPEVKKGIYSPWLYYINPKIFPIINNTHNNFKSWLEMSQEYPASIAEFHELNNLVGEPELGALDYFAHCFLRDGKVSFFKKIYLGHNRVFKISHGFFTKKTNSSGHRQVTQILKERGWICMGRYTIRGQGEKFLQVSIGDYVYVCDGGNWLWNLTRITSDWKPLPAEIAALFGDDDEEFVYRETELIAEPRDASTANLKKERSHFMPSGYSTFKQVAEGDLDTANDLLFIPKFNAEFVPGYQEKEKQPHTIMSGNAQHLYAPNIILYGPPGTGKTFHSISYAVAIVEGAEPENFIAENEVDVSRKEVKQRFDEHIKAGQIQFCTFHQSLGYEDFIEGIKPSPPNDEDEEAEHKAGLSYEVTDGMFKRLCTEAAYAFVGTNEATEAGHVLEFSDAYDRLASKAMEARDTEAPLRIPTRTGADIIIEDVSRNGNMSVRHDTGGRKYIVSKARLSRIAQAFPDLDAVENIHDQFRGVIGGSNATAYYAVLREIRGMEAEPQEAPEERERSYEEKNAAVKELTQAAFEQGTSKRFVLIIDEINRGNVSSIFGELITLLEEDKRLGKPEALRAKLPYSGEDFGVPPNLYVIGTMNTADRSVEALDTALRRRFAFVHKGPQSQLLKPTSEGIDLQKLLAKLNRRLTILVDADHTIGHAWLMGVQNLDSLKDKFKAKILPLLQEYFYNDYEKLGLVLGKDFFKPVDSAGDNELADFDLGSADASSYTDKAILELKDVKDLRAGDFIRIYDPKYNADKEA